MIERIKNLDRIPGFRAILEELKNGKKSISVSGLVGSSRTLLAAWLFRLCSRPVLYISCDQESSEKAFIDFKTYLDDGSVASYPSWEIQPYEIRAPHAENIGDRLKVLYDLQCGRKSVICAPAAALIEPTIEKTDLSKLALQIKKGDSINPDHLVNRLINMGFVRRPMVEQLGDFAVRGGIIDVFPATAPEPVRIELFGDEVDSMRAFSVLTQRSLSGIDSAVILPLREISVDSDLIETAGELLTQEKAIALHQALGPNHAYDGLEFFRQLFTDDKSSILDFLEGETIVIKDDPDSIRDEIENVFEKAAGRYDDRGDYPFGSPDEVFIGFDKMESLLQGYSGIELSGILKAESDSIEIRSTPQEPFGSHIKIFADKLNEYQKQGYTSIVFCDGENQKIRLGELLGDYDIDIPLEKNRISSGFGFPDIRLWFLTDHEIFARTRPRRKIRRFKEGIALSSYQSLKPGDYVVHIDYGIGKYRGLETLIVDGRKRDCLLIFYAGDDKLYVPIEEFSGVQKFAGKEGKPALSRLGTGAWEKTKARARKGIMNMARDLVALYARRQALGGFAHKKDTPWLMELEASFEYEETPDQLAAINEIKGDLEKPVPMDRLICGDVGYGKTEVAIRAAFKAVESGKQVAVLVPTTILAQQHLTTFRERLAAFPIKIEMLSRFRSPKESKLVKEGLKNGTVDIVIGTHKLLQKDIEFKDLALLVVDEEQRFGVTHKEKIRKLRSQVDTLTLTATPIPRTLQLSLLGARDMSVINTPPKDRLPIVTEVSLFSQKTIADAINRELIRGGQVYFVHNRVESIYAIYRYLKKLIPAVSIVVGHGQMPERQLERVMLDFIDKKYQVLLATTIIESGLDIPSVNTIVIDRADKLGLAQLYQLRGRVGRSSRRAYAHLLVPPLKLMKEKARKRLRAIEEFTELGSGFHLAMRDLEIRGAGNILGAQQHGFIEEIGFDLYCRLVEEAVAELKQKEPPRKKIEFRIQTDLDLFIPDSYIEEPDLRVELYRNVAEIDSFEKLEILAAEIQDRYGKYPRAVEDLLNLSYCRLLLSDLGAERLSLKNGDLLIEFRQDKTFSRQEIEGWRKRIRGKMEFKSTGGLAVKLKLEKSDGNLLRKTLQTLLGRGKFEGREHSVAK
ncbi:MAG: transcription-repair coupling factor [Candidatus Zixiibacteriota bacterium]|nr:MAG: transcription-repair coupling factor [candidate division Zixibacteria bacterium]